MNFRTFSLVLAAFALVLSPGRPAEAKLEGSQWGEAEKNFRATFAVVGETEKKTELSKLIFAENEPRAYRLIAEGLVLETGHVASFSEKLVKMLDRLQELLGMKYGVLTGPLQQEMFNLQDEVSGIEKAKAGELAVQTMMIGLASQSPEGFRKEIIKSTYSHAEWYLRAVAARVAASAPDEEASKPALIALVDKEKDPRVRLAAIDGLAKAPGASWHALVAARCEDPEPAVQVAAARVAGEREVGKAIPNLIHGLAKANPRVSEEFLKALRKLTGQNIEGYEEPWAKWWEANRAKYGEDGRPLQPVISAPRPSDVDIYGMKVKSNKLMYILDISGSMNLEKKAKATTGTDGPAMKGGDVRPDAGASRFSGTKIEIAKLELKRSLQGLSKESKFNILAYNQSVLQFQPKMMPATDANKELAYAWIRDMQPSGSTYTDGALQIAFKMAGLGRFDKEYGGAEIDTILLLSDGAPTNDTQDGALMDFHIILDHVKLWNVNREIIIHCIGIDQVFQGIEFMKKLAAENGGIYIDG